MYAKCEGKAYSIAYFSDYVFVYKMVKTVVEK
jgi:hypothetical protein